MYTKAVTAVALVAALCAVAAPAQAQGINDPSCVPAPDRPYPVVLAHGQGGHFLDMQAIANALAGDGHCVYATLWGKVTPDGLPGRDHLGIAGDQLAQFVDQVLTDTGAAKVNVVGFSAGTGALNNFILAKGGDQVVHRMASFGGLHHPYAHVGVARYGDVDLFLPNLIVTLRKFIPGITAQQVARAAVDLYALAGEPLGPIPRDLVTSPFVNDLFEPSYWIGLHGGLSEEDGTFLRKSDGARTLPTGDAAPNVCYTNFVGALDLITGGSAGWQDEAPNVENILLLTPGSGHGGIISDPSALEMLVEDFAAPCDASSSPTPDEGGSVGGGASGGDDTDDDLEDDGELPQEGLVQGGCRAAGGDTGVLATLALLGLALALRRRRA